MRFLEFFTPVRCEVQPMGFVVDNRGLWPRGYDGALGS